MTRNARASHSRFTSFALGGLTCVSLASSLLITLLIVLIILIIVVNQVGLLLYPVGADASHLLLRLLAHTHALALVLATFAFLQVVALHLLWHQASRSHDYGLLRLIFTLVAFLLLC